MGGGRHNVEKGRLGEKDSVEEGKLQQDNDDKITLRSGYQKKTI